jgi:hypothetical protein
LGTPSESLPNAACPRHVAPARGAIAVDSPRASLRGVADRKAAPCGWFGAVDSRPPGGSIIERLIASPTPIPTGLVAKDWNSRSRFAGSSPDRYPALRRTRHSSRPHQKRSSTRAVIVDANHRLDGSRAYPTMWRKRIVGLDDLTLEIPGEDPDYIGSRGNMHDLRSQIHDLLPPPDYFRRCGG